jgi:hypothetical protein
MPGNHVGAEPVITTGPANDTKIQLNGQRVGRKIHWFHRRSGLARGPGSRSQPAENGMFVPRVYGLGDLSQILDERAYAQASALLVSARDVVSTFERSTIPTSPSFTVVNRLRDGEACQNKHFSELNQYQFIIFK